MGNPREHFGHSPEKQGEKAARDLAKGKITQEEFKEQYKQAKDIGVGESFKSGFSKGASKRN